LGTVKTSGTENATTEVRFNINGFVTANINGISDVNVRAPSHAHDFFTAQVEANEGEPVIPWGTRAFYGTPNTVQVGPVKPGGDDTDAKAITQNRAVFTTLFSQIPIFQSELTLDGTGPATTSELIPPPDGTVTFIGENFWASPLSETAAAETAGRLTQVGGGGANDSGVIDTNSTTFSISSYASPGTYKSHSHLITLDAITNPQTDFTYGAFTGAGVKYQQSLPTSNAAMPIQFNQSEVLLELNDGVFTFNTSIKPIPVVALQPTKTVPIISPFHKVKYIIKAY
jgi:hypothetical protein